MVRLTIIKPEQQPEFIDYEEPTEVTVGRNSACNICLDFDPMVSRMHAVLLIDPPSVRIKDLNSTNGITINGENYGAGSEQKIFNALELRDGDEVIIGHTRFRISLVDQDTLFDSDLVMVQGDEYPRINSRYVAAEMAGRGESSVEETVSGMAPILPQIPGYRLIRYLASGMTGSLYMGLANTTGKTVAIKIITPAVPLTPEMVSLFERECAAAVSHPNLMRLTDCGTLEKNAGVFFVSEYVNGESLQSFLHSGSGRRIALHNAYNLMLQITGAVCEMHKHGFTHLDLKPSGTILFDDNGRLRAKLTDQGFADFMDVTGLMSKKYDQDDVEKLGYVAPEVLTSDEEPGTRADVFSLAAMFFEMLAGRPPYAFTRGGDNRTVVAKGEVASVEENVSGLPEPLAVILERGLSVDPEARYATACELLEALENVWV